MNEVDLILIFTTFVIVIVVFILVLVYLFFNKKKTELLFERQQKQSQFDKELATAIIEMKETTLSYIGQELHDDLGQKMSVAKLMINHGIEISEEGELRNLLEEVNQVIGESIRDIRSFSKTFITEQVQNFGLIESLEKEFSRINRLKLLRIDFQHNINFLRIKPKDSVILFRIIQECINNSLKHSRAKNLTIRIEDDPKNILIYLKDDGIGFVDQQITRGSGLISMKKRANLIHTDFKIESELEKGTTITLNYKKQTK